MENFNKQYGNVNDAEDDAITIHKNQEEHSTVEIPVSESTVNVGKRQIIISEI